MSCTALIASIPSMRHAHSRKATGLVCRVRVALLASLCLFPGPKSHPAGGQGTLRGFAAGVDIILEGPFSSDAPGASEIAREENEGLPRILTILTTYNKRTPYIKAYREMLQERTDGYEPMIFVTSDEEDDDPDGVIDYKFGPPERHRLLAAIAEANRRYEGQYDWIAVGDDDTVFMYNRALTLLKDIDHTQPVALGQIDGLSVDTGKSSPTPDCMTPEEKQDQDDVLAATACCLDFTRPCRVPEHPEYGEFPDYGPGGLHWPYGGSGAFISAGLVEEIKGSDGMGWDRCTDVFGSRNTDLQLGMCMAGHGLSWSAYNTAFRKFYIADPRQIWRVLHRGCQIVALHLGLRHLRSGEPYSPELFKTAGLSAQGVDEGWQEHSLDYLAEQCPQAWEVLAEWLF